MAKLYFKYGAMGSSKTAQALITKFNYEEKGLRTVLLKPSLDTRDSVEMCVSRIGLSAKAVVVSRDCNLFALLKGLAPSIDVVIVDECQFLAVNQVNSLGDFVVEFDKPVLCFGLRTDFKTELFPASKRLFELAESVSEIKCVCECGKKATFNARIDDNGDIVTEGERIVLGGNETYVSMCRFCYARKLKAQKVE